jgi:phosphatidylinositol-3,4,5-trisphosphate 3-phosphatase and dual-specificity protein phosphatase PTEN
MEKNLKDESEEYSKKWTLIGCFNCNNLRQCVSLKKKRLRRDNFDLDLTYITKNVIAMGYPADGFESVYRNNQRSVSNFLLESHYTTEDLQKKGMLKVKIYNLCIEKSK